MFSKSFNFRRKSSDDRRQPSSHRTTSPSSQSCSPHPSPSDVSIPIHEDDAQSTTSNFQTTHYSNFRNTRGHSRKNSEANPGALGLNIIYTPECEYKVDIVFIHGLGGASRRTWSKNEDPRLFWPMKFLPFESDVRQTRILTFGYNANFRTSGNVSTSVLDFAKDLLFDLRYAKDEDNRDLNIGDAYMQGQNDPNYEAIIKAISAITFLATPHRGTNLADLLDRILRSTFVTNSKLYVSELAKNSFILQRLNEQFRHIAPRLEIVSFYETQSTSIGLKRARVMILEKESSVLGYPGETSKALDADHHNVCKFDSPKDPNYITVKNALGSIVSKIISTSTSNKPLPRKRKESGDLKTMLAITEIPDVDYIFFRDQWAQGTCDWVLKEDRYLEWLNTRDRSPALLWLNGGAATGKSVLASFIINNLVEQGFSCQYFFMRFGNRGKRSLSLLLRSIAYQIARDMPEFMEQVLQLGDEAMDFATADPRTLWESIYKSVLITLKPVRTLYWVIDGLDEADDPRALIRLFSGISILSMPIRVLLLGRRTNEIVDVFQKLPQAMNLSTISIEGHLEDIRNYIGQELCMSGNAGFTESVVERVVRGAQNNFLWVHFTIQSLNLCHTEADVELALQSLPIGMEAIYDRMASTIAQNPSTTDRALASTLLQCATVSLRVLAVAELEQALQEDMYTILDLQRSIVDLCGGFVVIDNDGNVAMVHQTAREYLLNSNHRPFCVDKGAAHKQMFENCMRSLMTVGLRARVKDNRQPVFLEYAAKSWSSHLMLTPPDCARTAETLSKFLGGHWVLVWIQLLATYQQLGVLVEASKHLSRYYAQRKQFNAGRSEQDHLVLKQELVDKWAEDLVKVVGKFGMVLRGNPESIYKLIPPFCPQSSAIYQQFGRTKDKSLVVSGLLGQNWDDSIARMSFGPGTYASSISTAGSQIAILISSGRVILYDALTFEEATASPIRHSERVYRMELASNGTLLATYGYLTTRIWETSTGLCKLSVPNIESRPRPLAMLWTRNNTMLLVGTDDRRIRSLDISQSPSTWQLLAELDETELEGHILNSSNHMALNSDGRLIAVAYRGHPLSAWEIDGPVHIGHCWRTREEVARGEVIEAVWHPHGLEVLGLYIEGVVFKWRPYDDETDELATGACRLAISRDGNLFATGDVRGMVKIYTTAEFGLLYRLASEDTVLSLTFSPDLRRFYDVRGNYGNAWEPNALTRFSEQRSTGGRVESDTESLTRNSAASESWTGRIDAITALAGSPIGRLYCCGTEQGVVHLHDTKRGKLADIYASKSFFGIEQVTWSNDGRYLCFSDSSKKVVVRSMNPRTGDLDPLVEKGAEITMKNVSKGPMLQLLFHPDSSKLLVRSSSTALIISIADFSLTQSLELHTSQHRWVIYPQDPALIMDVGPRSIRILDWDLAERQVYNFHYSQTPLDVENSSNLVSTVDRVLVTTDKRHLLAQISLSNVHSKDKAFLYFRTPSCSLPLAASPVTVPATGTNTITPYILPLNFSSQVAFSLSFLSQNNLVFLSRDFSVRSQRLAFPSNLVATSALLTPSSSESVVPAATETTGKSNDHRKNEKNSLVEEPLKFLFSLPGDWISRDCLALCAVWGVVKSVLCPRNGEVAVVRSREVSMRVMYGRSSLDKRHSKTFLARLCEQAERYDGTLFWVDP
ncbi:MAG: hypothetical protein Q9177_001474 [Variospora cf. flavescens]